MSTSKNEQLEGAPHKIWTLLADTTILERLRKLRPISDVAGEVQAVVLCRQNYADDNNNSAHTACYVTNGFQVLMNDLRYRAAKNLRRNHGNERVSFAKALWRYREGESEEAALVLLEVLRDLDDESLKLALGIEEEESIRPLKKQKI